jgi:ATP-dependent DNA helicase RecG
MEKPSSRLKINTSAIPMNKINLVIDRLSKLKLNKKRAFWICPLIKDSEKSELSAATERYNFLSKKFGKNKVGLVHGKMKQDERDKEMVKFANGEIDILVGTTVIEVGINVPEASLIIIEHSERFGLSQLHQLRGRVGRSNIKSDCLLLYSQPLSESAYSRIKIMRETNDGFKIAEKDLLLRGTGEILGTKQSGLPNYKIANLEIHNHLLEIAYTEAKNILEIDSNLTSLRGKYIRDLLYLFEQNLVIRHLNSG